MAAILLSLAAALPARADVTLKTKDGSLQITGQILNFDGKSYDFLTAIGQFDVPVETVDCFGEECPAAPDTGILRAVGSDLLVTTLLPEAVRTYARLGESGVRVTEGEAGSTSYEISDIAGKVVGAIELGQAAPAASFEALLSGRADAVFASRRVTNPEVEMFLDAGLGDPSSSEQERIIAQDGLVAVVSPSNPVRSMTLEEIEGVFSGRITNWSELGGPNQPIRVIAPADKTGESDFFFDTVLDPQFADYGPSVERVAEAASIPQLVAPDVNAIGLTSTAHTEGVVTIALAGDCGLVTDATPFNIKAEDYPLSRRLYLYTSNAANSGRLTDFIQMLDGEEGQSVVERTGFISLSADATSLDGQGRRLGFALADRTQAGEQQNLRSFAEQVVQAYRLSTTFRFSSGSSQLDNKSQADARRLADFLARPENLNREVLLIGFTDSIGQSNVNTVLSVRRAQQVLDEILAAAGGRIDARRLEVLGYGASAPIACNTTDGGRQLNRRVEVWLR